MNTASNSFQKIWNALPNKDAREDFPSTDVDKKASCAHEDDPDEVVPKRTVPKRLVETVIGKIEAEELAKIKSVVIEPPDYEAIMNRFLSSCIKS